jgi:TolA-binding protein
MIFKYFMTTFIVCLFLSGCGSEKSLENEFQQLQNSMTQIAAFKERCEVIIKDSAQDSNKPEATYYLGRLNELFAHYEEAIKHYRYLLIAFPGDVLCSESLYRIGYIYEHHIGDITEAKTAYNQLITFYPGSTYIEKALISHAQLSCEQEEWQQAMDYFNQYVTLYPESRINEDVRYRLVEIMQYGIKDTLTAEASYRKFLVDYPQSSWRLFAEEKLEELKKSEDRSSGVQEFRSSEYSSHEGTQRNTKKDKK